MGRFGQQVRATGLGRQAIEQVIQEELRSFASPRRDFLQRRPFAPERYPHRFHILLLHLKAADTVPLTTAVMGDAPENAQKLFR